MLRDKKCSFERSAVEQQLKIKSVIYPPVASELSAVKCAGSLITVKQKTSNHKVVMITRLYNTGLLM